ncbi:Alcohol dehydrogenase [acceptor] [Paraconexibacter sp. AEG42_29]|uniref:Alcohol dehydrogenase [acceptor] n=1 Tax=Paraconexibacter sp. AEG42_29 TaxID=2997339 RepID=A0AAU7APJ9_9ACTN
MRLDDAISMNPDYIVVGAGPAGCVVASRLSEDPNVKVLLIEAGRSSDNFRVKIPIGPAMMITKPGWDWCWETPPDPTMNGRHITWSAGKVVGGGSSVHGQVNMRCLPSDYDEWATFVGDNGDWSYEDMLPYLIKCEHYPGSDSPVRGRGGPLNVADMTTVHPLAEAFVGAGEDRGYARTDLNGEDPIGFGLTQATQKDGRRFNVYDGYIRPHAGRPNLGVLIKSRVVRVVMENGAAVGVEVAAGDTTKIIHAAREVIVSAGTIASANLLMKSGVGPGEVLQSAGVPVAVEVDGVGRNLQEHSGLSLSRFIKDAWSLNAAQARPDLGAKYLYQLLVKKTGPFSSPVVQAMGYVRTHPELPNPDLQLHFLPFAYRMKPESRSALAAEMPKKAAVAMQATLCKPNVRGQVRITNADAESAPMIDHHLLGDERDLQTLVAGCKLITDIFESPRFAPYVVSGCNPLTNPTDDAGWVDYVRNNTNIAYHQVGTCRMGRRDDPAAVVDPTLKVIGADRLRVIDASVMPTVPSANTYIPTVAVGEKGAEMIARGV